jgi:hypothetical protein
MRQVFFTAQFAPRSLRHCVFNCAIAPRVAQFWVSPADGRNVIPSFVSSVFMTFSRIDAVRHRFCVKEGSSLIETNLRKIFYGKSIRH